MISEGLHKQMKSLLSKPYGFYNYCVASIITKYFSAYRLFEIIIFQKTER